MKKCLFCKKDFDRRYREGFKQWDKRKFCSRKCFYNGWKGKLHPNWKGGQYIHSEGYRVIQTGNSIDGYEFEHTVVMTKYLGRKLESWELVHHKDGNRLNNNIENLELSDRKSHPKIHKSH